LKKKIFLVLVAAAVTLTVVGSCGKKGPPFIPEKQPPHRVKELKGEWVDGDVLLSGKVGEENGQGQEVAGCKVYHAWYPLEGAPCEGCPIDFKELQTIEGEVVKGRRFKCMVSQVRKKGIHYFRVALMGADGEVGPSSNTAKVSSE
jgi:predicted small lipoprotein YifL